MVKNTLSKLQFKNVGIVTRDMHFIYEDMPCYYAEDLYSWRTDGTYKYLYEIRDGKKYTPPVGIRSAVPLGGLGAGTIELRADGSFRDWNIFNNSPAGGREKIQLDDAIFGFRTKTKGTTKSWALRTHPPENLPAIAQIEYSGAFPVSRLRFTDNDLPLLVDLYAYCEFYIHKPESSATPAIIFSFNLCNTSEESVKASIMFNLPNHITGNYSFGNRMILEKSGTSPTSGSMVLRVAEMNLSESCFVEDDLINLWTKFVDSGTFCTEPVNKKIARHGALSTSITLAPGQSGTVTFVLSWYFPYRAHGNEILGNYYTKLYTSAEDVANKVIARLSSTLDAINEWQNVCFKNSLPDWLQDAMVNSLGTMYKTGMWFADGRWRQWESFSCPAVEPIHIHSYRSLAYVWFFPSLQQNLLRGYASTQTANGYIQEDLGICTSDPTLSPEQQRVSALIATPIDQHQPKGRILGDCCPTFLLLLYENYRWTGDKEFFDSLWLNAKKAIQWQIQSSEVYGLPNNINNTYDLWGFRSKNLVSYNAFMHLAAMLATEKLAEIQGDMELVAICRRNVEFARESLNKYLWTGNYFRAWWCHNQKFPDAIHSDTLYEQLWCCILGLGWTVDPDQIIRHLDAEYDKNASPFGLKVIQGTDRDNDVRPGSGYEPNKDVPVHNLIFQVGSLDWASLNIYMGGDVQKSLLEARKVINHWAEKLCDQWDYWDLTTGWDGYPWCNSHYSRQLILWAIPIALSGLDYSAPEQRLCFKPKVSAPAKLPFFTPTASGTLELLENKNYILTVLSGELELNELVINEGTVAKHILLKADKSLVVKNIEVAG